MIGSAILKPSIQPGCGWTSADSTMLGRRTVVGTAGAATSSTKRSPMALVNV